MKKERMVCDHHPHHLIFSSIELSLTFSSLISPNHCSDRRTFRARKKDDDRVVGDFSLSPKRENRKRRKELLSNDRSMKEQGNVCLPQTGNDLSESNRNKITRCGHSLSLDVISSWVRKVGEEDNEERHSPRQKGEVQSGPSC